MDKKHRKKKCITQSKLRSKRSKRAQELILRKQEKSIKSNCFIEKHFAKEAKSSELNFRESKHMK
jgi:hypothetical protein